MAAPSYIGNGGIDVTDNSATVAVTYPALQANDILILQLLSAENDTHQTPSGFAAIGTQVNESTNQTSSWWWKRAAGSESGDLTCNRTNSGDAFFGVMSCWRGARLTGTPFNSAGPTSGNSTAFSSSTITPTYDYSAVICLVNEENNVALGTITGFSEAFEVTSSTGDDAQFSANYIYQTTKAQVTAATGAIANNQSWATITLALWSPIPLTINATKATATGTPYNATVQIPSVPTTINATKATATGTSYAATVEADVDTTISAGKPASKNIWSNPGIESGIDDWNDHNSGTVAWSTAQKWGGSRSLEINPDAAQYAGGKSDVKSIVAASTQYTLSYYIYPLNGAMNIKCIVQDQGGTWLGNNTAATTQDTWTRRTLTFSTGVGDTGMAIFFEKNDATGSGHFFVDGVQVELGASATDWVDYAAGGGPVPTAAAPLNATLNIGAGITATKATATTTPYDATVIVPEPTTVSSTKATATATGYAATVQADVDVSVAATASTATGTAYAATVQADVDTAVTATAAAVTAAGKSATVTAEAETTINATVAATIATQFNAVVSANITLAATKGSTTGIGNAATVQADVDTTISAESPASKNIWSNPSIESGIDDWDGHSGGTATWSTSQTWHGSRSLEIDSDSAQYAGGKSDVKSIVAASTQYTLSYYIYPLNGAMNIKCIVQDQGGTWLGNNTAATTQDTWTRRTLTFSTGAGDTGIAIFFEKNDATGSGHFFVDGFQVELGASATDWVDYAAGGEPVSIVAAPLNAVLYIGADATISATLATATGTGYDATVDTSEPVTVNATKGAATGTGYDAVIGGLTYYVRADGSAANKGAATSDAAAGTSMSIATHNGETFGPGDTIVISDAGGVYRGQIRGQLQPPSVGSSGNPIVYSVSGSPVFDGGIAVTGWTAEGTENVWQAASTNPRSYEAGGNILLDDVWGTYQSGGIGSLAAEGDWYWASNILYLYSTTDPDAAYTEVTVPYQHAMIRLVDDAFLTFDGIEVRHCISHGIYLEPSTIGQMDGLTFRNIRSHHNNQAGFFGNGTTGNEYINLLVEDSRFDHNGYSGAGVGSYFHNPIFRRLEADHNGLDITVDYVAGLRAVCAPDNGWVSYGWLVENCKCYSNGKDDSGTEVNDAAGIWIDTLGDNSNANPCIVRHNATYDNTGEGLYCENNDGSLWYGNISYGNVGAANDGKGLWCSCSVTAYPSQNNVFYNNTLYGNEIGYQNSGNWGVTSGETAVDNIFRNNIVSGNTTYELKVLAGAENAHGANGWGSGNVYTNNCIGAEATSFINWALSNYSTYDAWEAVYEASSSVESDPAFKDAANGKFYLTSASPCIDSGVDLGDDYDDALDPNLSAAGWPASVKTLDQDVWGSGWEVGAYVYDYADAATATATTYAASVLTGSQTIAATKGTATATGYDATVEADVDVTVMATLGTATGTAYAATVEADVDTTISATAGTATATGYDIGLAADLVIPCTSDAVVGAGYDASVLLEAGIAVSCGSLTGTAFAATVTALADTTVTASSGTATGTAYAATVQADVDVAVTATLGTATTTDYAAVVNVGTGITATAGVATATGYDVALAADNSITATLGTATGTANAADIILGAFIAADVAAATITGYDPTVLSALAIPATAGVAIATGYDATVAADLVVPVTLGVVTVTGSAAGVEAETAIAATVANAIATALNASISGITTVGATKATATVTGYAAEIGADVTITATLGAATLAAFDALLSADVTTVATKGTVTITGCNPLVLLPIDITATLGTATATANAVAVNVGAGVGADTSAIIVTAHNPTVYAPLGIDQTSTPAIIVTGLDATVFEGIINITCGTITVTARVPTVTIPFRFLIEPTITSTSIDYDIVPSSTDYGITSTSYDYDIEALA